MSNADCNELETLFEEAKITHTPHYLTVEGHGPTYLLRPKGMEATDVTAAIEAAAPRPKRIKGTVTLDRMASLVGYVQEFKRDGTTGYVYATQGGGVAMQVVFDHHRGNATLATLDGDDEGARWCGHTAGYAFPISPELAAWKAVCGKDMSQEAMAVFLEDRLAEVCPAEDPGARTLELADLLGVSIASASSLLGFARRSAATVNLLVVERRDPATGSVELIYQEEVNHQTEDKARITPPGVFAVALPVLVGGEVYRLPVRLRSKVKGRSIVWSFEVYRLDKAIEAAVDAEVEAFTAATGIPVYRGRRAA
jgi:uncharacterized protein YfdQ (DUF2303 family)